MSDASTDAESQPNSTPVHPAWERLKPSDRRQLAHRLGLAIIVLAVLPFLIYAVPQLVGASQSYVVVSGSMEPALSPGDVIVVNSVQPSAIEVGDVITFGGTATAPPTTHRVVEIRGESGEPTFLTKGDNNENVDLEAIPAASVRGKVMELPVTVPGWGHSLFVLPFIGYVIQWGNTTLGFLLLVAVPLFLLAVTEFWQFYRAARSTPEATAAETNQTLSIPRNGLVVGVAICGGLAGFGFESAYQTRSSLMATIAVGATVALLLILTLLFTESGGQSEEESRQLRTDGSFEDLPGADAAVAGTIPDALSERASMVVASPEALFDMASQSGTVVIHDEAAAEYVLFEDGVAFTAPEDGEETTTGTAEADRDGTESRTNGIES